MKKQANWLLIIMTTIALLTGCNQASELNDQGTDIEEGTITVIISDEEAAEMYSEEEITIEDNAILMDVMKDNYDIEESDGFINSIEGIAPEEGEKKAWIYSVNGEDALVGAAEYELSINDDVVFDLQSWE